MEGSLFCFRKWQWLLTFGLRSRDNAIMDGTCLRQRHNSWNLECPSSQLMEFVVVESWLMVQWRCKVLDPCILTHHRHSGLSTYVLNGLWQGDEHSAYMFLRRCGTLTFLSLYLSLTPYVMPYWIWSNHVCISRGYQKCLVSCVLQPRRVWSFLGSTP